MDPSASDLSVGTPEVCPPSWRALPAPLSLPPRTHWGGLSRPRKPPLLPRAHVNTPRSPCGPSPPAAGIHSLGGRARVCLEGTSASFPGSGPAAGNERGERMKAGDKSEPEVPGDQGCLISQVYSRKGLVNAQRSHGLNSVPPKSIQVLKAMKVK